MSTVVNDGSHKYASGSDARAWFNSQPVSTDPDYVIYFRDFINTAEYAAADWTITTVETGAATEALGADALNGTLVLTNGTADNDSDSLQLNEETFALAAGKQLWFETKVQLSDATDSDLFIGLGITDTSPLATTDRVGFQKDDDDTNIDCLCEK